MIQDDFGEYQFLLTSSSVQKTLGCQLHLFQASETPRSRERFVLCNA
jgi:hypothetical protein